MQIHSFSDVAARTFDNWEIQRVRLEVVAFSFTLVSSFV